MISPFVDDDAGYEAWLRVNPGGYVVNTYLGTPSAMYLKVHRSSCRTISGYPPSWYVVDRQRLRKETAAPVVGELAVWAREELDRSSSIRVVGVILQPS